MNENQRTLLSSYISNVSKTKDLKVEFQKQIKHIEKELLTCIKNIHDKAIKIKLKEISNYLKKIKGLNIIKEAHILSLMRYHELIEEIKNANK